MSKQSSSYNTQVSHKPHSCTCSPTFNELHFEWDHQSGCGWSVGKEQKMAKYSRVEGLKKQEQALKDRVLFAVKCGKSHTVSPKLLKKYGIVA